MSDFDDGPTDDDAPYAVYTDNGALYLRTWDREAAFREAAEMNSPGYADLMRAHIPDWTSPGTARVFEERIGEGLVEITPDTLEGD